MSKISLHFATDSLLVLDFSESLVYLEIQRSSFISALATLPKVAGSSSRYKESDQTVFCEAEWTRLELYFSSFFLVVYLIWCGFRSRDWKLASHEAGKRRFRLKLEEEEGKDRNIQEIVWNFVRDSNKIKSERMSDERGGSLMNERMNEMR